ncbi:ParB/RepB/Spo0J family partition protein [Butyrivibrio sp. INlla16]|uniref:ParB/RepB/Spo0J family partition protein n=1 Tax=Butyrivibrio sp. INlla16 TaxID=1520807 RepID=UPI000890A285|nr:ParB/RepB/Spo0J family partition protein [Butyrivibrio sp. INlla16]SDB51661.1 chromosome partitioning protein, ParB family [Butyrivibrio sp. INlla16]
MASRVGQKIQMTSIDELLGVPSTEGTSDIDVMMIFPFKNHPFKVLDDEKMDELVDSIKMNGVLTPVIVRPDGDRYEMISGHRRLHAAKRAGLRKIPAIVKEMQDDDAIIFMVDSNLQREEILPSEKAFSYKMKLDAMKRQGARKDLTSSLVGTKLRSDEELAQKAGESKNSIHRYIRLTELIPELLDLVDDKDLPLYTAVEMSYFAREIQKWFYEYCNENRIPKWNEVAAIRNGFKQGELTQQKLIDVLNGNMEAPSDPKKLTFTERKLNKYFPAYMSLKEREDIIISLLEKWKLEQEQ